MYKAARERYESGKYDSNKILSGLEQQLKSLETKKKKLLSSYTSGLIGESLYTEEVSELQGEGVTGG